MLGVLLWAFALLLVLASLLPFLKSAHGLVRGLAFPRQQLLIAALFCAVVLAVVYPSRTGAMAVLVMTAVAGIHAAYIIRFTPFWSKQSVHADADLQEDRTRQLRLLAANVKKSNRDYKLLIDMIHAQKPDLVMAIEVDQHWIDGLKEPLAATFPYWVDVPMDNGYGICVMSRLALSETRVRELVTQSVPSVQTVVQLENGEKVRLYVVHPEPPVVNHDTIGRDSEIAMIGLEVADDVLPAIVAGDLNDVAWSSTTRRFQRLSGLVDPRVGRGFYNTFNALIPMMRWPLDHLFHDTRFRLIEMKRLGKIGSDHFPMLFVLGLAHTEAVQNEVEEADVEEVAETTRMIRKEQNREREAIGGDWEDE